MPCACLFQGGLKKRNTMKKHLIYKDTKSDKFWQIEVDGNSHTVVYGKTGSKGISKTKEFDSIEKALKDAEKLVKAKIKKGYTSSNSNQKIDNNPSVEEITKRKAIDLIDAKNKDLAKMKSKSKLPSFFDRRIIFYKNIIPVGDTLIISDSWYYSRCLDAKSGDTYWRKPANSLNPRNFDGRYYYPIDLDGKMLVNFIGHLNEKNIKNVLLIDPKTREIIWRQKINAKGFLIHGDKVYCHNKSMVYALNKKSGKVIWKQKFKVLSKFIWKNHLVVNTEEKRRNEKLNFVDLETGEIKREIPIEAKYEVKDHYFTIYKDELWYINEINPDEHRLIQLNLKTTRQKIHFDRGNDFRLMGYIKPVFYNKNLYLPLIEKENLEQTGLYEVNPKNTQKNPIKLINRWSKSSCDLYQSTNCLYLVHSRVITEMNLKTHKNRKLHFRNEIVASFLENGELLLLQEEEQEKRFSIQVIH